MKKYVFLFIGALSLTACVKHVIIPTPEVPPVIVEFDCEFNGNIDGTSKFLASGVNGFECSHLNTIVTVTDNDTKGVWYNEINHPTSLESIRLTHGELAWVNTLTLPTEADWKDFYLSSQDGGTVMIANGGISGIELSYTDVAGTVFKTRDTSLYPSTVIYANLQDTSASNGSFITFTASIDCKLYSEGGTLKKIDAATIKGAYKYQ